MTDRITRLVEVGYDHAAHDYARLEEVGEWPRMRWLAKLLNRLESGAAVLDLGCGSGTSAGTAIAEKHRLIDVDISRTQTELARHNVPSGKFVHADISAVDFPPATFDAVVSFYTLEHRPRKMHSEMLQRIYEWLKPGGLLLISIEAGDYDDVTGAWLGIPMFISCFEPETTRQLVSQAKIQGYEPIHNDAKGADEGIKKCDVQGQNQFSSDRFNLAG